MSDKFLKRMRIYDTRLAQVEDLIVKPRLPQVNKLTKTKSAGRVKSPKKFIKKNTAEKKKKNLQATVESVPEKEQNFIPPPFTALSKIQWEENRLHTIIGNSLLCTYFTQYLSIYSPSVQEIFKLYKELLEFEKGNDFTKEEMETYAHHLLANLGREKTENLSLTMFVEERLEHETMLEELVTKFMLTIKVL